MKIMIQGHHDAVKQMLKNKFVDHDVTIIPYGNKTFKWLIQHQHLVLYISSAAKLIVSIRDMRIFDDGRLKQVEKIVAKMRYWLEYSPKVM